MKLALAAFLLFSSVAPATQAYESQGGYAREQKCYKKVYREKYIPGTMNSPGYVKSYKKRVKVPCENYNGGIYMPQSTPRSFPRYENRYPNRSYTDDNSCVEGSILGGIAGAGAGAALSRGDGRWWAIPLGIVGGSMVGCQIDGG